MRTVGFIRAFNSFGKDLGKLINHLEDEVADPSFSKSTALALEQQSVGGQATFTKQQFKNMKKRYRALIQKGEDERAGDLLAGFLERHAISAA